MKPLRDEDIADPILYRLYWSLILGDILHKLGYDATKENKMILHDFHKRILEYDSIAGKTQEGVSKFIFEVGVLWSWMGIFFRTKSSQPMDIEQRPLREVWEHL